MDDIAYNDADLLEMEEDADDPGNVDEDEDDPEEQDDEDYPCTICKRTFKTGAVTPLKVLGIEKRKKMWNFAEFETARHGLPPGQRGWEDARRPACLPAMSMLRGTHRFCPHGRNVDFILFIYLTECL